MHNLLPTPLFSVRDFTWKGQRGIADFTDLKGLAAPWDVFGQVFNDACDVGLSLLGKTGREIRMGIVADINDAEELRGWVLKPVSPKDQADFPELAVVVVND